MEFEIAFFSLLFHSKTLVLIGRAGVFTLHFNQLGIMGIGRVQDKFRLTDVAAFVDEWQAIYNGASVHVGKGATFGLGR